MLLFSVSYQKAVGGSDGKWKKRMEVSGGVALRVALRNGSVF